MRRPRSPRRRRARQRRLDHRERLRERVDLGRRQGPEQRAQPFDEQRVGRGEGERPGARDHEPLPAAIVGLGPALDQPGRGQCIDELRGRRAGDAGPLGECRDRGRLAGDGPQGQVLRRRERRVVSAQQALDPARRQRGDGDERPGGVGGRAGRRGNEVS
jgi:hypothetical protein